jgi:hypothetical protein
MKEVEQKNVPEVSGGIVSDDNIGLPFPPFPVPDPGFPQLPSGPFVREPPTPESPIVDR